MRVEFNNILKYSNLKTSTCNNRQSNIKNNNIFLNNTELPSVNNVVFLGIPTPLELQFSKCSKNDLANKKLRNELFLKMDSKVQKNINHIVENYKDFGISKDDYLYACSRNIKLLRTKFSTIEDNVTDNCEKFKDKGFTKTKFLTACKKQPELFLTSPEKIENNAKKMIKKCYELGINENNFYEIGLKQPDLLCKNINDFIKRLNKAEEIFQGTTLSFDDYVDACIRYPRLFTLDPAKAYKNVNAVAEHFKGEGLTLEKYLRTCVERPQLFVARPLKIKNRIEVYKFVEKNISPTLKEPSVQAILKKPLDKTDKEIYSSLLRRKIFGNHNYPPELRQYSTVYLKLKNHLKNNPDIKIPISITEDNKSQEFIEFAKALSKEALGRDDVFEISIISNDKK